MDRLVITRTQRAAGIWAGRRHLDRGPKVVLIGPGIQLALDAVPPAPKQPNPPGRWARAYSRLERLKDDRVLVGFTVLVDLLRVGLTASACVALRVRQNIMARPG